MHDMAPNSFILNQIFSVFYIITMNSLKKYIIEGAETKPNEQGKVYYEVLHSPFLFIKTVM